MKTRRAGVVAVVAMFHALLLALLVARSALPPPIPPSVEATVMRMIAAPAPVPIVVPPPPEVVDPVAALVQPDAPVISIAATSEAVVSWAAAGCSPLDAIGHALAADPLARAAIAHAPPGVRSDAGAIALWNGGWADAAASQAAPLAPVRAMIERTLAAAPPACLDTAETGPRLVVVQDAARPTLLVLGSGQWRWRDLASIKNATPDLVDDAL